MMAIVWFVVWCMWLRLAGRSGRLRVRDGGHAHMRGRLTQDLCSSHVRCLKSSAPPGWAVLRRRIAEMLCASRDARAASQAATGVSKWGVSASW